MFEGGWRVVKRVKEGLHMGLKGVERVFEGGLKGGEGVLKWVEGC